MKNKSILFISLILVGMMVVNPVLGQLLQVQSEVDKEPAFKGKPAKIHRFFDEYMKYPKEARINLIEGVVEVSALITDGGKLLEPQIYKSVDPWLDAEALRLVSLMQEWKPAKNNKQFVDCKIIIKVPFYLSEDTKMLMETLHEYGLDKKMPLFIIDDKIVKEYIEVPHYNVKSVRVLKGEKAIQRYGDAAKNGVVIITTKRGTPPVW